MSRILKIPVKPLHKPIKTLINIRICRWRDKYYGNSYCSARVTVNNDFANELVFPFSYSNFNQQAWKCLEAVTTTFKGLQHTSHQPSAQLEAGILVTVTYEETTKKRCKSFGER
jgi:hypothetical protein